MVTRATENAGAQSHHLGSREAAGWEEISLRAEIWPHI
jgi:hypothetical protein